MKLHAPADLNGMRATVMGLGLHGGGLAAAQYLAAHGAEVTVTDLRDEQVLAPSLEQLSGTSYRAVLGRHENEDFTKVDLVIKNPGVPRSSHYLALARRVETDISLFLRFGTNPLLAVTGSKGKSTVASAVAHGLHRYHPDTQLGGNITISPLGFLDRLGGEEPVVLELSSFQLGDLRCTGTADDPTPALDPAVAVLTNIMHDHLDYYSRFEDYVLDKEFLFAAQEPERAAIYNRDDPVVRRLAEHHRARVHWFSETPLPPECNGVYLEDHELYLQDAGGQHLLGTIADESSDRVLPINRAVAALALWCYGIPAQQVFESLAEFSGIEHRLELVAEIAGVRYINDSAATIPPAAAAAAATISGPLRLIAGGADKNLDLEPFARIAERVTGLYLLAGNATDRIVELLRSRGLPYRGPYADLASCLRAAVSEAEPGDAVVLSPGCASFGMFLNEFDRGRQFKQLVEQLTITVKGAI